MGHSRTCQPIIWKMRCTVFFEPEQVRRHAIPERWRFFNHRLDRFGELRIDLRGATSRISGNGASTHAKPAAQLGEQYHNSVSNQALLDKKDQFSSSCNRTCNFFDHAARDRLSVSFFEVLQPAFVLSSGLECRALPIPRLASPIHCSNSEGIGS